MVVAWLRGVRGVARALKGAATLLRFLVLGMFLLLSTVACSALPGMTDPTPTPVAKAAKASSRPTVEVKRGSIVETVKLLGRVSAVREADLYFPSAGRLKSVNVTSGQEVTKGQLLAQLDTGDLESRLASAEVSLDTAKVRLEQAKASRGDAELRRKMELNAAEMAVQQAEAALAKAEADLVAVKAGPTPVETAEGAVRDAELNLDSARRNLTKTENSYAVAQNVRDRENEANWYEANYGEQLKRYERGEIDKAELDRHYSNLLGAKERLATARAEADAALQSARNQVAKAEEALRKAQADLEAKKALPPDSHIREAERVVTNARLSLEKAKADYSLKLSGPDEDYEITLLEKAVDQAQASVDELKAEIEESRIVAPFDGKAVGVRGRIGDQVSAYQQVVSIADPSELQVKGDLMEADIPKVAIGQLVELTVDSLPGVKLKGSVVGIPSGRSSQSDMPQDRSVQIKVEWEQRTAQLGMLARISITVQKKDDVLIVPVKAIKTVGKRQFVEYMDGSMRRSANVEVGIATDTEAEILAGLTEGQVILAGQ